MSIATPCQVDGNHGVQPSKLVLLLTPSLRNLLSQPALMRGNIYISFSGQLVTLTKRLDRGLRRNQYRKGLKEVAQFARGSDAAIVVGLNTDGSGRV